jgi:hypothetical protein
LTQARHPESDHCFSGGDGFAAIQTLSILDYEHIHAKSRVIAR